MDYTTNQMATLRTIATLTMHGIHGITDYLSISVHETLYQIILNVVSLMETCFYLKAFKYEQLCFTI